jgi:hypothetical protein
MGLFSNDPKFEALRKIREDEGYDGWLDQDNNKVKDVDEWAEEKKGWWK